MLTPPQSPQAAPLSARPGAAVTLSDKPVPGMATPQDQQIIDEAEVPDATLQRIAESLTASLAAELQDGVPPDVLLTRLAHSYPKMDTRELEEMLARAMFVGEVWGRISCTLDGGKE